MACCKQNLSNESIKVLMLFLQEVPELCVAESQPKPPPSQTRPAKSKRHSRKSFVSKILGAATSEPNRSVLSTTMEHREDDWDKVETGSYTGNETSSISGKEACSRTDCFSPVGQAVINRGVKEVNVSSSDLSFRGPDKSKSDFATAEFHTANSFPGDTAAWAADPASSCRDLNSSHQPASVSMMNSSAPGFGLVRSGAFTPVRSSSSILSMPPHSLLHPPSSEPPSSAFAKIRTIPKTKRRSEQPSQRSPLMVRDDSKGEGESGLVACIASLKEVFSGIVRLASILERATQLSRQDLMEEK